MKSKFTRLMELSKLHRQGYLYKVNHRLFVWEINTRIDCINSDRNPFCYSEHRCYGIGIKRPHSISDFCSFKSNFVKKETEDEK